MRLTKPQQTISDNPSRFRVVSAGRRFGKTFLSINEIAKHSRYPGKRVIYIAPTYRQAKTAIWQDLLEQLYDKNWIKKVNQSELTITLVNGSQIFIRSSDNHQSLRGSYYHFAIFDECADIAPETWYQVIRPTLSDTQGSALFIGTPKSKNWFYDLWCNAGAEQDWASFSYTTLAGGNVAPEEIEAAKRDLGEKEFEQEYLAAFVTYSQTVFYAFSEQNMLKAPEISPNQALHCSLDFNISPMSCVIFAKGNDVDYAIDEILIWGSNSFEMVKEIHNRYGAHRQYYAYPDASGAKRTTNSTGLTDHIIFQNNGFRLMVDPSNPPVLETIGSVNARLCNQMGERKLFIDPKCKNLREALIKHSFKEGTRIPEKGGATDFSHITDCVRYYIHKTRPIQSKPQNNFPDTQPRRHHARTLF